MRTQTCTAAQARFYQGMLAREVADLCVAALISSGHLPRSHGITVGALPMQLPIPPLVVGRRADMDAVRVGLQDKHCVLLTGGPGEGKSTVARAVGTALWDAGAYKQGAFELDMTSEQGARAIGVHPGCLGLASGILRVGLVVCLPQRWLRGGDALRCCRQNSRQLRRRDESAMLLLPRSATPLVLAQASWKTGR
jgi:hypothetical protein